VKAHPFIIFFFLCLSSTHSDTDSSIQICNFFPLYSYYQKVPQELPELEKHQVYGLATPEDFTLPPHHTLWTEETYKAFEVSSEASEKYDTKVGLK
jgi:hypothetical protein